jgi:hypothetical protein
MKLEEYLFELAQQQFGENLVGIDFFGPFDGDDLMGELILAKDIGYQEAAEKLFEIYRQVEYRGWSVSLGWIADGNTAQQNSSFRGEQNYAELLQRTD